MHTRSTLHTLSSALLALGIAAIACNYPLAGAPTDARSPHPGLVEQPRLYGKRQKHAPINEILAAKALPPVAELPRLTPEDFWDIEIGPPGESPDESARPSLSGSPQTLDTEHFRIHYTLSGSDRVPSTDTDGNGHPDYVEEVARAMEYAWHAQIEVFGWPLPPEDGTLGGDGRTDVYIENLIAEEEVSGYATDGGRGGRVGDNPNTTDIETRSTHAYMALDNDFSEVSGRHSFQLDYMRSTAAHEYMHIIQYGIDGDEPAEWLWESAATWIQDEVLNQVNDANFILGPPFKAPDSCQVTYGGDDRVEDEDNWYGQWLFLRFISERLGHATVRSIWEWAGTLDGYAAIEQALNDAATDLDTVQVDYAIALLTRDFEEGEDYPVVRLEGLVETDETFTPTDGVGQMGADFIEIKAGGPVTIVLEGDLSGRVIGVRGHEIHIFEMPDGRATLEASAFERIYLIVINPSRAARERECRFTDYTVEVTSGGEPQAATGVRARAFFRPPRVETLQDPSR
ncbi:MAG: hypothetical protein EPO32_07310 [Anaerolineae bacterium]|nr:MAG: hypothetical protein EPO32_07310 [Anaerolineae bacterium]